jgi:hypothetical protein
MWQDARGNDPAERLADVLNVNPDSLLASRISDGGWNCSVVRASVLTTTSFEGVR